MKYFKKLDNFNNIKWVAELENCTDSDAIEITKTEYNKILMDQEIDDLNLYMDD